MEIDVTWSINLMASEFPQHFHELSVSATFIETQAKKGKNRGVFS